MFVYLGLKFTRELALRLCVVSEGGERLIAYLRAAHGRGARSRHLRDETHVVELSLPFRAAQKRRLTMTCAVLEAA
jgi:hypothetical protein